MSARASNPEQDLIEAVAAFQHDPLGYVLFAFPWGEGALVDHPEGPREWQREVLREIGEALTAGTMTVQEAVQHAVASGHGIGKSALVAWIILWALSTFEDTRGVVTANTESQLKTKTWAELAKWHRLALNAHWFVYTATALYSASAKHEKTWRVDMVPWSERNTEAFAGLHNQGKRVLLVFDEASAIPDVIWEVSEGALTDADTEIIWAAFGNPTRNNGRFKECFGRLKHRWRTRQIDSRTVPGTNKTQIAKWVADYGEDSDFVRVRVRGIFPVAATMQFIGRDLVDAAMRREIPTQRNATAIVGVDVARFGDDQSVIRTRIGRDARQFPAIKLREVDTMQLAGRVAEHVNLLRNGGLRVVILVDGGGVGGGVVDRLRQLGFDVIEVQFGGKADDPKQYYNKRAEMYGRLREWLTVGALPEDDEDLATDLTNIEYGFTGTDQIQLERKERMKDRGLASPDDSDAIAITFAVQVHEPIPADAPTRSVVAKRRTYDPYADLTGR